MTRQAAAAAGDAVTDDDGAEDMYDHPTCTERQVLHTTTEAQHVVGPHCCHDHVLTVL